MGRQFQKGPGESYPDVTRFTERAPEPKDEQDADAHKSAAYAISCENDLNNFNHDAAARGKKYRNIQDQGEGI